jgi:hypothetical protein
MIKDFWVVEVGPVVMLRKPLFTLYDTNLLFIRMVITLLMCDVM